MSLPKTVGEWVISPSLRRLAELVAYRRGLNQRDADDLLQEVRLALLHRRPDLPVNLTYVLHTAVHKAVDMVRERRKETPGLPPEVDPAFDSELIHLLRIRISALPANLRTFCQLRFEEGLTYQEIADRLGLCRGSVRWMEARSLRILRLGKTRKPIRLSAP
jgi:RNA polymerase sigma factor (sigma-70 family)